MKLATVVMVIVARGAALCDACLVGHGVGEGSNRAHSEHGTEEKLVKKHVGGLESVFE